MTQILKNIIELEQEVAHQKMQLSIDSINMSFGELINLYKNKELIIRPEHQRFFRWTAKQKTALIESMLLSITLPPIFVAEDENGIWELGTWKKITYPRFCHELHELARIISENSCNSWLNWVDFYFPYP
jgi:hypothetical protein